MTHAKASLFSIKAFVLLGAATALASNFSIGSPAREPTAEMRVQAALKTIERVDEEYKAVIRVDNEALERARALDRQRRARGPLFGEPILLKDNIESATMPTTAGSLALAENHTNRDAPLVRQLQSAGAIIIGKSNLSEWANFRSEHSSSGWSGVGGQSRNAVDKSRSPCGSSSGSAVAVALGYVDIAIGTETSGSIVCPAAINGVGGFKPTLGLISGDGIVPLAGTQDTAGPIAIDVALAAKTLAAMIDPSAKDAAEIGKGLSELDVASTLEGIRFGVFANTQNYDPRRDAELERVLRAAKSAGGLVIPDLRIKPYDNYQQDAYDVLLWEFRQDINDYLAALPNELNTLTLEGLIAFNEAHSEQELQVFDQSIFYKAQAIKDTAAEYKEKRENTRRAMREDGLDTLFEDHELDVLIGITVGPAWMIDSINGDAFFGPSMAGPAAVAGNPHITLPLGSVGGMPLGISLIGERHMDHRLAAIANLLYRAAKTRQ